MAQERFVFVGGHYRVTEKLKHEYKHSYFVEDGKIRKIDFSRVSALVIFTDYNCHKMAQPLKNQAKALKVPVININTSNYTLCKKLLLEAAL